MHDLDEVLTWRRRFDNAGIPNTANCPRASIWKWHNVKDVSLTICAQIFARYWTMRTKMHILRDPEVGTARFRDYSEVLHVPFF